MSSARRRRIGRLVAYSALALLASGCRRGVPARENAVVPPGLVREPGVFVDVSPRWSHDGRRVAFLRRTTDRGTQVCIAPADLSRADPLTAPEVVFPDLPPRCGHGSYLPPDAVAWTPDDAGLAVPRAEWFKLDKGLVMPGTGLWLLNATTRRTDMLAVHPRDYAEEFRFFRAPCWSRDGRRIAFVGESVDGSSALFVRTLRATKPVIDRPRFDAYSDVGTLAWSPDGGRLAFRQRILRAPTADPIETVRVIEPGGRTAGQVLRLTLDQYRGILHLPPDARVAPRVTGIAWSPDESRLAIAIAPDAKRMAGCAVWLLNLRTGAFRRVSPADGAGYTDPLWIDGARIGALRLSGSGVAAALLPATGGRSRVLCALPGDDYDWSPDRKRIVCAAPSGQRPTTPTTLQVIATGL